MRLKALTLLSPLLLLCVGRKCSCGSSPSPILLRTAPTHSTQTFNGTGFGCVSLLPPRRGSFYVETGTGVSLGSVLAFWCHEGFQLVGSERISCVLSGGVPRWSNYLPVCEGMPKPQERGLRVAVLVSVISGIVILTMSASFIVCCLQKRLGRGLEARRHAKSRKRRRRRSCWMERPEDDWDALPPPKVFHLSHRLDLRPPAASPLYTGGLSGFDNRGYQRSQESLQKVVQPGLYCSQSQVYPHVVLQRVPTPTAPAPLPVYLHHSSPTPEELHRSSQETPCWPWP